MQLMSFNDLRMTDYNMACGKGVFETDTCRCEAELFFYLQGPDCLDIRLGRHDKGVSTKALEDYLSLHKTEIRRQIRPEIQGLRAARGRQLIDMVML
jgi:hypothetical protein